MRSKLTTLLTVIGAVTVLVLAGNTVALATTGHSFLLGKANTANKMTTLKRTTPGTALNVRTKRSYNAPLATNGRGRVTNLNADMVDGLHATSLQTKALTYALPAESSVSEFSVTFPSLPSGVYQAHYNMTASMSASAPIDCEFNYSDTGYALLTYGSMNTIFSTVSGGGIVDTRGRTVKLRCFTFSGTLSLTTPSAQISFTRVDSVTSNTAANARIAPSSNRSGASH